MRDDDSSAPQCWNQNELNHREWEQKDGHDPPAQSDVNTVCNNSLFTETSGITHLSELIYFFIFIIGVKGSIKNLQYAWYFS